MHVESGELTIVRRCGRSMNLDRVTVMRLTERTRKLIVET